MTRQHYDPELHYDRVIPAWELLLGHDLHYGYFSSGDEALADATQALTRQMLERAQIRATDSVLDVGCGTGQAACFLADTVGCQVMGISTSRVGVERAQGKAAQRGLGGRVSFAYADATDNGLPSDAFDRLWVMESSHLMRRKDLLLAECARVARAGCRMVLCDIILRGGMSLPEVIRYRDELLLLRDVFGDAKMEPLDFYATEATRVGFVVDRLDDVSAVTEPTFDRWRTNAERERSSVVERIGEEAWTQFVEACGVLQRLWKDEKLGYGIIACSLPRGARDA